MKFGIASTNFNTLHSSTAKSQSMAGTGLSFEDTKNDFNYTLFASSGTSCSICWCSICWCSICLSVCFDTGYNNLVAEYFLVCFLGKNRPFTPQNPNPWLALAYRSKTQKMTLMTHYLPVAALLA
jgi:hypothetical protein